MTNIGEEKDTKKLKIYQGCEMRNLIQTADRKISILEMRGHIESLYKRYL